MKSFIPTLIILLFFGSCITSNYTQYNDPNYLHSHEFSSYEEIAANNQVEDEVMTTDDTLDTNISYENNYDYYDYSFSSRIRRFHQPMYYYNNYYGGIYTDYYWYNNNPYYWGTSIYYGYNWHYPYYSYYSYLPYYYGNYYSFYSYPHHAYYHSVYNTYNNRNNFNGYINGRRINLASSRGSRVVNTGNKNITSRSQKTKSNLNIRTNNSIKNNTINGRKFNSKSTINTKNSKK